LILAVNYQTQKQFFQQAKHVLLMLMWIIDFVCWNLGLLLSTIVLN
jgi:hypothetical protein